MVEWAKEQREVRMILNSTRRICYCRQWPTAWNFDKLLGQPIELVVAEISRGLTAAYCSRVLRQQTSARWPVMDRSCLLHWICDAEPVPASDGRICVLFNMRRVCPRVLKLTETQCRVLQGLLQQEDVSAVAKRLGISPNTVRTHLRRSREVAGQPDLRRLMSWIAANEHGLGLGLGH